MKTPIETVYVAIIGTPQWKYYNYNNTFITSILVMYLSMIDKYMTNIDVMNVI